MRAKRSNLLNALRDIKTSPLAGEPLYNPLPQGEGRVRVGLNKIVAAIQIYSPLPLRERARERGVLAFEIASGDAVKSYDAACRAAADYFSLLVQRKVVKRKHTPRAAENPCASRQRRGPPDGASLRRGRVRAPGANPRYARASSAFDCDARRRLRGPKSNRSCRLSNAKPNMV